MKPQQNIEVCGSIVTKCEKVLKLLLDEREELFVISLTAVVGFDFQMNLAEPLEECCREEPAHSEHRNNFLKNKSQYEQTVPLRTLWFQREQFHFSFCFTHLVSF